MMRYNRIGSTRIMASAVGFGTCQLRLVPEQQAIDTLKRGFELGVNLVHASPDYEGADELVAQAIKESDREVIVLSQGYGEMRHFEYLFESACRKFKKRKLEMFGIGCIDDREYLGEDVWGPAGMVQFLLEKKMQGRLTGIYCSTHGEPEYVARLIKLRCFDAIMISYNVLGFHLLSYNPEPPKKFEDITQNSEHIFPLAAKHGVGLFIMKPLAGGLLCKSRAFPPHHWSPPEPAKLSAMDLLRAILMRPEVCSVIPGTASVEEAEENALAGHPPHGLTADRMEKIERTVFEMKGSLCSRCGDCDPLCSKSLPISWLFRDAYICNYPSETFETLDRLQYFQLHSGEEAACESCERVTCYCTHGSDIPAELIRIHRQMLRLRDQGLLPANPLKDRNPLINGKFPVKVIRHHVPKTLHVSQEDICRFYLENAGKETWRVPGLGIKQNGLFMCIFAENRLVQRVPLRHDVGPGERSHFSFAIKAPRREGDYALSFILLPTTGQVLSRNGTKVFGSTLSVTQSRKSDQSPILGKLYACTKDIISNRIRRSCKIKR